MYHPYQSEFQTRNSQRKNSIRLPDPAVSDPLTDPSGFTNVVNCALYGCKKDVRCDSARVSTTVGIGVLLRDNIFSFFRRLSQEFGRRAGVARTGGVSRMEAHAALAVESERFPYSPPWGHIIAPHGSLIEDDE